MIDQQSDGRCFKQRQQRQQLIAFDLQLQQQVEIDQFSQEILGPEIGVGAMERGIECDADNAARFQALEFGDTDIVLDHRDALEAAVAGGDGIEQTSAVGAIP